MSSSAPKHPGPPQAIREVHSSDVSATLLEWCQRHRIVDAAVFERHDEGWTRVAHCGLSAFPRHLTSAQSSAFQSLELADGLVLFLDGIEGSKKPSPESSQLLAASLRIVRLERQLKAESFQAKYRGVELEAIYDVGLVIASTLDLTQLSEDILLLAVSLLDARRGALFEVAGDRYQLRSVIGGDAAKSVSMAEIEGSGGSDGGSWAPEDLFPDCEHSLAVTIESGGNRLGLLAVGDKENRHGIGPFTALDRRTLSLFARQAAIALENAVLHQQALEKERMERDMELAAEIQRELLPRELPELDGYCVFGWNRPARQVGGDYFDVRLLDNGNVVVVVADVSGKGVPAALMVATLHSALRLSLDRDVEEERQVDSELLEGLNRHLLDLSLPNKFITLLLVELDPKSGTLRYLNAGHNPGLLLRPHGPSVTLDASGPPLGLLPASRYCVGTSILEPGDLLCLYSDGITECASRSDEEFGAHRLEEALREGLDLALPDLSHDIDARCKAFSQGQPQGDDQTVLLLRREPTGTP